LDPKLVCAANWIKPKPAWIRLFAHAKAPIALRNLYASTPVYLDYQKNYISTSVLVYQSQYFKFDHKYQGQHLAFMIREFDEAVKLHHMGDTPFDLLDIPIGRFFASLRFEQRGKLDQLGVEIGSFD
jgi:hypothetical protein